MRPERAADTPLRLGAKDLIPSEVLDACSLATRNMGYSSVKRLGVTSCRRGEGRSTIAAGLATTLACEYSRKTILVDLDLDRASQADWFGVPRGPGVAELLRGEVRPEDCPRNVDENLMLVPAGTAPGLAKHLLHGSTAMRVLESLEASCDVLVADLPPLTPGSGATQLTDLCGTVTMVVRSGAVDREEVAEAVACLTGPVYAIINDVRPRTPRLLRRFLGLER
jgi:Mrp family chromosome partitioning ATPase